VLADARTVSDGEVIESDVCVLGAGPVGLVLARLVGADGARICMLEGGSLDFGADFSDTLDGEVTGDSYLPLRESRAHGFGGTTRIWRSEVARDTWGARYGTLEEFDFEQRDDDPHTGWPFKRGHLENYYERAAEICEIDPLWEDQLVWENPLCAVPLPLGNGVSTRIVRYGFQSVFTETYLDWAKQADNVTVYLHGRALEIESNNAGRTASRVLVASAPGRSFRVAARLFVLALGGIENARLLLLSNTAQGRGLGNQHDLVGRFFMDHPTANCLLLPAGPRAVERMALYDTLLRGDRVAQGILTLSDETLRHERLLNSGSILAPTIRRQMRALRSVSMLRSAVRARQFPVGGVKAVRNIALGIDVVAAAAYRRLVKMRPTLEATTRFWPTTRLLNTLDVGHISGWSRLPVAGRRFRTFSLFQIIEQGSEPDRRVTLSSRKDSFGQPLSRLHWFIAERELESMLRTQQILATAFAHAGIGKLVKSDELARDGDVLRSIFPSAHHHMGTTRMHTDPRHGVVDENCRVHGMTNLFVSGTSVFPTGGYINPTLTAIALSVRLADHVKGVLRSMPERPASV
jgi:choline dehydrogenase-like flavoprotein